MMEQKGLPVVLVFNKKDVAKQETLAELASMYEKCGYKVLKASAACEEGISEIKEILKGKTTTVAGPSGVGKSTIINLLQSEVYMETGTISEKIERGKHTTRHSELITIDEDTYIFDTPGFSSLYITDMEKEELKSYFPEFYQYEEECKFLGCVHVAEPVCGVKAALEEGKISKSRYENYKLLYEELKENEKRKYS
jgi:ribosome biogenesis GTPase